SDPAPDRDLVLVFDAGLEEHGARDGERHGGPGGDAHGLDPLPGPWTVNGLVAPTLTLPAGSRVRARLINASNTGYLDLRWPDPRQIANDQGLLAALERPTAGLVLAPGDRADVEWLVGSEPFTLDNAPWSLAGGAAVGE